LIRLAVRVSRARAELVLAELLELSPNGVEEVGLGDSVVEYALYGAPGELPELPKLQAAAGTGLVEVRTSEVAEDWAERWRAFHRPLVLGEWLMVRPPWEPPAPTQLDVVIDPGRAFGTGAHATTRLCLELMLGLEPRGGFVDVGCGSGVLAIVAAGLGFAPVLALDNDPLAIEAARSNAAANEVELEVRRLDVRHQPLPGGHETVAANLLAPLLRASLEQLVAARPRRLIAGGILDGEAKAVAQAFASRGLTERQRLQRGGWVALLLCAPTPGQS
jgi:ribosomal protein L11 methyltransferase